MTYSDKAIHMADPQTVKVDNRIVGRIYTNQANGVFSAVDEHGFNRYDTDFFGDALTSLVADELIEALESGTSIDVVVED